MNRIDIIQKLIDKYNYKSYCEIGVEAGESFNAIQCDKKVGVDPSPSSVATHKMTSNDFFTASSFFYKKFDIYFIDGLHHSEQCDYDISNALYYLNPNGCVVVHDLLPDCEFTQETPLTTQGSWTGDVWKSWVKLRMERFDLEMNVVDCNWGCGIIRLGYQNLLTPDCPIDYKGFEKNKKEWMNIITEEEFLNKYII